MDPNKKFSKVTISARIDSDKAEAIKTLAGEKGMLISEVVTEIINYYFRKPATDPEPAAEPQPQKECIVISDMQLNTIAALLECSEKLKLSYPKTIDLLFDRVQELAGKVDPQYIEKAKEKFNLNK